MPTSADFVSSSRRATTRTGSVHTTRCRTCHSSRPVAPLSWRPPARPSMTTSTRTRPLLRVSRRSGSSRTPRRSPLPQRPTPPTRTRSGRRARTSPPGSATSTCRPMCRSRKFRRATGLSAQTSRTRSPSPTPARVTTSRSRVSSSPTRCRARLPMAPTSFCRSIRTRPSR